MPKAAHEPLMSVLHLCGEGTHLLERGGHRGPGKAAGLKMAREKHRWSGATARSRMKLGRVLGALRMLK